MLTGLSIRHLLITIDLCHSLTQPVTLAGLGVQHLFITADPCHPHIIAALPNINHNIGRSRCPLSIDHSGSFAAPSAASQQPLLTQWTFAKREAVLARLGLDPMLDNLPDEDFNKLFDKISKVKTMRGHGGPKSWPGPGLSHVDDIWNIGWLFSSDATDDSSWDAAQSCGSPQIDKPLKDVQNQLGSCLQAITKSSTEAEDLQMKKRPHATPIEIGSKSNETPYWRSCSRRHWHRSGALRLIHKVLDEWRAHHAFSMAEAVVQRCSC